MKKNLTNWLAVAACTSVLGVSANLGATTLNFNDSLTLGQFSPGTPAGDGDLPGYVNELTSLLVSTSATVGGNTFTRSANSFSPLDPAVLIEHVSPSSGTFTIPTGGAEYLMAKYAGGGNSGGATEVWYIAGLSGSITIPTVGTGGISGGLSGFALFTPDAKVPDGGTTVLLLGAAISGLGLIRRKLS